MPAATDPTAASMKVGKIFIYPVKSLRAYEATSAQLDRDGFRHDRTFMLLARHPDGSLENMHVSHFPELVLMFCSPPTMTANPSTTITFKPPKTSDKQEKSIVLPLEPETSSLDEVEVTMHGSPTKAFNMGDKYNTFLSECLDRPVILAYLGPNRRPVLMSSPTKPPTSVPISNANNTSGSSSGWLSSLTTKLPTSVSSILGSGSTSTSQDQDKITFADCAPYLVVSEKSIESVSARLPEGEEMDITKFRPNIIVTGAIEAWEEDLWAELEIGDDKGEDVERKKAAKVHCLHNCGRCVSINIDYETGQFGQGDSGKILKMLQKDRRIDKGTKYSPCFGRYSFVDKESEGAEIKVGDEVRIVRRNEGNTSFDWPGLATN